MNERYTEIFDFEDDDNFVYDHQQFKKLTYDESIYRLNKQDRLIKRLRSYHKAVVDILNEEIENADGELKEALIRISKREVEYD